MKKEESRVIKQAQDAMNNGVAFGSRGEFENAIGALDKALSICVGHRGSSRTIQMFMGQIYGNKGAALGDLDKDAEALKCYDMAIGIYGDLLSGERDERILADQAIAIMNKGWALIKLSQEQEGFKLHLEALMIRQEMLAEGHEWISQDVARSLYNVGWGYLKTERYAKALKALNKAVEILNPLVAADQGGCIEDLAYVLGARADTLMYLGKLEKSLQDCNEVCAMLTSLALSQDTPRLDSALKAALKTRRAIKKMLKKTMS